MKSYLHVKSNTIEFIPCNSEIDLLEIMEKLNDKSIKPMFNEFSNAFTVIFVPNRVTQCTAITRKGNGIYSDFIIAGMIQHKNNSLHFYGMSEDRIATTLNEIRIVTVCK